MNQESATLSKIYEEIQEIKTKNDREQVIESKVNAIVIKYVWQNWQTILLIIGVVGLNLILTFHLFKSDFKRLEGMIITNESQTKSKQTLAKKQTDRTPNRIPASFGIK